MELKKWQEDPNVPTEIRSTIKASDTTDPDEVARVYGKLCVELKFLYVAITRPKNRLFIYDS